MEHLIRLETISSLVAAKSGASLAEVLTVIVQKLELQGAGVRWPVLGAAQVQAHQGDNLPAVDLETSTRLANSKSNRDIIYDPHTKQLLCPLLFDGRKNGVFWAQQRDPELSSEDKLFYAIIAQMLSCHAALRGSIELRDQSYIAQRLKDASVVAGKIAHDFDNIFTGVVGFAEMMQTLLEPNSLHSQYVSEIVSAGNRGIKFTQQLHQMSRSSTVRAIPAQVQNVLKREEARVRQSSKVQLRLWVADHLPAVSVEPGILQTVVSALIDNAVEASTVDGTIDISAQIVELLETEAKEYLGNASAGPFVEVRIADEGSGVTPENRSRLFTEPFFTTKVRHRGLGLPIVYRILHAHRGGVRYDPAPTKGSVIRMVLPLAAARPKESDYPVRDN